MTTGPGRPVPPRPMINAMRLMYAGAALAALGIVAAAATAPALRMTVRQQYPAAGAGGLSAVMAGALTATIVGGLISAGVWLALARRTRRGRPGVRAVSTVLFIIDSLTVLSTRSHVFLTPSTWIAGVAEWVAGLIVVVCLWDRRSSAYLSELQRARKQATPQWRATPPPQPPAVPHRRS